jgi:hypothetical protein
LGTSPDNFYYFAICRPSSDDALLETKLIVQAFLEYLRQNGVEAFSNFINNTVVRLVSTVHPNETEGSFQTAFAVFLPVNPVERSLTRHPILAET